MTSHTNNYGMFTVAEQNLQKLMSVKLEDVAQPRHVTEDIHVDPEADPVHFLSLIVESLAALRRMPQAIEVGTPSSLIL